MTFPPSAELGQFDLNHVMLIGQSNAVGSSTVSEILSPALGIKFGRHFMFQAGVVGGGDNGGGVKTPDYSNIRFLKEELDPAWSSVAGETSASGFAAYVGWKTNGSHRLLISDCGVASAGYATLAKGTTPYGRGLRHVREGYTSAARYSAKVKVRALVSIHGETDVGDASYGTNMATWQNDWQTDINALTGRTGTLPIFHTCHDSGTGVTNLSGMGMYDQHKANPTKNILAMPLFHVPHPGGLHRSALSHRWVGEYCGRAYYQQVVLGQQYEPLRPSTVVRAGAVITVTFNRAITIDTANVYNPGNYGFTYFDDTSPPTITSVVQSASTVLTITLSGVPSGASKELRAGYSGGTGAGPTTGRCICVRDLDTEVGPLTGLPLYNWCVPFHEAAT